MSGKAVVLHSFIKSVALPWIVFHQIESQEWTSLARVHWLLFRFGLLISSAYQYVCHEEQILQLRCTVSALVSVQPERLLFTVSAGGPPVPLCSRSWTALASARFATKGQIWVNLSFPICKLVLRCLCFKKNIKAHISKNPGWFWIVWGFKWNQMCEGCYYSVLHGTNAKKYCGVIKNPDMIAWFCGRGERMRLGIFSCLTSIDEIFPKRTFQTLGSCYITSKFRYWYVICIFSMLTLILCACC